MSFNFKRAWYRLLAVISVLWTALFIAGIAASSNAEVKEDYVYIIIGGLVFIWGGTKVVEWIIAGFKEDADKT